MATQLDFKALSSAMAVWYDGTYVYISTGATLYAYSFIGSTLTQITSISAGGPLGVATALWRDRGTYIYTHTPFTATLKAFTFNGATFTQKASIVYPGAGYIPSIGYAVRGDETYVYRSVDGNGGQKLVAYWWVGVTLTAKTDQAIGVLANSMVYQNSAIYLGNTTRLYRYTYNGTTFTQTHLTAAGTYLNGPRTMDGDGTYLYAALSGGTSIRVFNNTLGQVGSDFAEGLTTIVAINCFEGKIFVVAVDAVRIYTFNGSNFTLVDTISSAGSTAGGAVT